MALSGLADALIHGNATAAGNAFAGQPDPQPADADSGCGHGQLTKSPSLDAAPERSGG